MMATKLGLIKKTPISEFKSIRRGGKIAIKLNENDELIGVYQTTGNDEILMASSEGKCIRFNEKAVRSMGRDTMGVKSMKLSENEYIVDMTVIKPGSDMLTISEYGYGKRSSESEYRLQGRNGKGIKAGIFIEVTGNLVNLKQVTSEDDVMLIADDGVVIRVSASEISKIGRNTKGVRVMKMKDTAKIVCVAITKSEKSEEEMAESLDENEVRVANVLSNSESIVEDEEDESLKSDDISSEEEMTEEYLSDENEEQTEDELI